MLLAIETGYGACSVALIGENGVLAARHELIGRGHAERLVPLVGELLSEAGGKPDAIVVDVGPGSFTGLRVGIAAARGFGLAWRVPVTGFSSTSLVAASAFAAAPSIAEVTVAMEAGRGEVYVETFDRNLASAWPAIAVRPDAAVRIAAAMAGTGVAALAAAGCNAHIISDAPPNAANVGLLPPRLRKLAPTPIYVRAPDAKLPV